MSNKSLKEWNPKYDWNEPMEDHDYDGHGTCSNTPQCTCDVCVQDHPERDLDNPILYDDMTIPDLICTSHETAVLKGWWDDGHEKSFGEVIALIHSELSEALEEFRNGHQFNEVYMNGDKPEGIPIELADTVIRIADACGQFGIDLESAIRVKQEYNMTRPTRHGDKRL